MKPRRRARRSTDKRGPAKLTPQRLKAQVKRRREASYFMPSDDEINDVFNQS